MTGEEKNNPTTPHKGNAMKRIKVTLPGQNHRVLICDDSTDAAHNMLRRECSIVDYAKTQNQLRHYLALLRKPDMGVFTIPPSEIHITHTSQGYGIWVYTRDWESRAAFLGGILFAECRREAKLRKHRQHRSNV